MKVLETELDNVLLFKPDIFEDFRGFFIETYNEERYTREIKEKTGHEVRFLQDDISVSSRNVLRGIHGDPKTWKLVDCLVGKIYLVVVNCDKGSENFRKWQDFNLSDTNRHQILIPPKFGSAHLVLSDRTIFHYKQSKYYDPGNLKQFTYGFDDPNFNIWWPIKDPILSKRDELGETLK